MAGRKTKRVIMMHLTVEGMKNIDKIIVKNNNNNSRKVSYSGDGGYFKENISDSNAETIQITTDKSDYETYKPKEFTLE